MGTDDQGLKRLLQAFPENLLHFALGPDCEYLGMLDTDVAIEPQLIMDRLFHARYQGDECAVDFEVQGRGDPTMPQRMFRYAQRGSAVYDLRILSIVLWLRKGKDTFTQAVYEERVGDRLLGTWVISGIEVFNLHARDILQNNILALLPLVPFMQGGDLATIEEAAHQIEREMPSDEGKTLSTLLAVFTAEFFGQAAAKTLVEKLKMDMSIVEESPLYQEWVQRAKAEGLREGKTQAMRAMAKRILEGRFTTVDADLVAAIDAAAPESLDDVVLHIATDSLAEIRARLGL